MRTVITYGTFDLFHQGHYNILKRAKEEGDYLIVGVTGETYDEERGKLSVQDSLATRIDNVKQTGFADKVIVEEYLGQKISDILKYHVDVLVIGSDWKGKFDHLSKYCEVKYLERTKNISSTQLREENLTIHRFGIVTDELNDRDCIMEAQRVSGIHVECVFAEDQSLADLFCEKYELNKGYSNFSDFLYQTDIVYVKTSFENRIKYVRAALEHGKHVVYDPPCTLNFQEKKELSEIAVKNNVVLMENVPILYLQAFGQLQWMARGNLIGDLINVKCSISSHMLDDADKHDFLDILYVPVCVVTKILGLKYEKLDSKIIRDNMGEILYAMVNVFFENNVANIEVSLEPEINCGMTIYGTKGEIQVPDDWWKIGYFKMKTSNDKRLKHYSSNFDGNGFRYIVQDLLREIKSGEFSDIARISEDESAFALNVFETMGLGDNND